MVIDADCHISSRLFGPGYLLADKLVEAMDAADIDKAVVWLRPVEDRNIEPENRAVFEAACRHPTRLLPFGWTNPRLGRRRAADIIRQCFDEYGFLGLKFNGAQDGYPIDDERRSLPLIEQAAAYGKPLAFHIGADAPDHTHPRRLARIAALFPHLPLLMVHMGGAATPPLDEAAVGVLRAHPNVTAIGSSIAAPSVRMAIDAVGAGRVCFGSDMPFASLQAQLAMYAELLRDRTPQERGLVLGGAIAAVLGLAGGPSIQGENP